MVLLILILIHSHESGKRKEPPVIGGRGGGGGVSSFLSLIHAFSHGQLCSPLEMVRLLAGYGFDEQINGNGYKRKASKVNQTSLSTVRGTLYRIRGKLRIFVDFHM